LLEVQLLQREAVLRVQAPERDLDRLAGLSLDARGVERVLLRDHLDLSRFRGSAEEKRRQRDGDEESGAYGAGDDHRKPPGEILRPRSKGSLRGQRRRNPPVAYQGNPAGGAPGALRTGLPS